MDLPPPSFPPSRFLWRAAVWVALCLGVGLVGSVATATHVATWYPTIAKPSWTPPPWLFGPVWTLLYGAMGVAAALVHTRAGSFAAAKGPLGLFLGQLALNGAWSWLFFGLRSPAAGLAGILPLTPAILATILAFRRVDRRAALLLVPYALWVAFATALNAAIWRANA